MNINMTLKNTSQVNRILLFVNVFDTDRTLLEYGVSMAKSCGALLELFDVQFTARTLPRQTDEKGDIENRSLVFDQAENRLTEIFEWTHAKWKNTRPNLVKEIVAGRIPEKEKYWLDRIHQLGADLVVMRCNNPANFWNAIVGFTESRTVVLSPCPVFILPKNVNNFKGLKKLAYVLDRKSDLDKCITNLEILVKISNNYKSLIKVYYATDAEEEAMKLETSVLSSRIAENSFLKDRQIVIFEVRHKSLVIDELLLQAENSLFAIAASESSLLENIFGNQNPSQLILDANIPLIFF